MQKPCVLTVVLTLAITSSASPQVNHVRVLGQAGVGERGDRSGHRRNRIARGAGSDWPFRGFSNQRSGRSRAQRRGARRTSAWLRDIEPSKHPTRIASTPPAGAVPESPPERALEGARRALGRDNPQRKAGSILDSRTISTLPQVSRRLQPGFFRSVVLGQARVQRGSATLPPTPSRR